MYRSASRHRPFDPLWDYRRYVDGKVRYDGVASFLASRGIALPYGDPSNGPDEETVCGLGNRKNAFYREHLKSVCVYPSTVDLIRELRSQGFATAVVSASRNCAEVLGAARLGGLFDTRVDGIDLEQLRLPGKPAPDSFLEAARRLGIEPSRAIIVEDAIAGVEAGRRGGFGCVVGVGPDLPRRRPESGGADIVVADLAELGADQ